MQSLLAKHGKAQVVAGPLKGKLYEEIGEEKLQRAAKRYSNDPAFQKFARGYMLLKELEPVEEPAPCVPVNKSSDVVPEVSESWLTWFLRITSSRRVRYTICISCLVIMLRPSATSFLAKLVTTGLRLWFRRLVAFIAILLEGVMDEMIFQLEYTVKEALPVSLPETTQQSFSLISHALTGCFGAGVAIFMQLRRTPVAN